MRFFILSALMLVSTIVAAQRTEHCYDDSDTLLIVGGALINSNNYMIDRTKLQKNDSVFVNRPGFVVESFKVSAFTLGQKVAITNTGNVFNDEVMEQLINNESIFKFFYLKDIILRTNDGRKVSPSTRSIKITFELSFSLSYSLVCRRDRRKLTTIQCAVAGAIIKTVARSARTYTTGLSKARVAHCLSKDRLRESPPLFIMAATIASRSATTRCLALRL